MSEALTRRERVSECSATVAAAGGWLAVRISITMFGFWIGFMFDQVFPQGGHVAQALQLLHT